MNARPLPCPTTRRRLALGILLLLAAAGPATGETFTVDSTADAGVGSLREAVLDANTSADTENEIVFDLPDDSTITLLTSLAGITQTLVIDGTTATNVTIEGDGSFDLFSVSAGTTSVQDTTLEMGSLEIDTGAGLSFDVSVDQTFDGAITNTPATGGALEKTGTATLILLGTNTYAGGTLVSEGTLQGNHQSLQGVIANNATLVFDQQVDGTFVGAINGLGSVEKTGPGTLTIRGTVNTYTGGTTVSEGTLDGDTDSIQGDVTVANSAIVIFNQAADGSYTGNMSGSGSLALTGGATITLSGANSYSGGTGVNGATTLVGDASAIQGNITIGASTGQVVFDEDGSGTHTGVISGAGGIDKIGTGTLTLRGANTYTGGTSVTTGVLAGDSTSLQGDISVQTAVTLIFDQSSDGTYAGVISGMGDVTKTGGGRLTFTGANDYEGLTAVSGGQLNVNGSLTDTAATVRVDAGAVLGGEGSVAGKVRVNGAVAPGDVIGTLTANEVVFRSGSTLQIDIEASRTGDLLQVTDATIMSDSTVVVNPLPGSYSTTPFTISILTSTADRIGDFLPDAAPDFAFLDLTLDQTNLRNITLTVAGNTNTLVDFARTPNQRAVALGLDAAEATAAGDLALVFENLKTLSAAEVPVALDDIGGESLSQFATTRLAVEDRFHRSIQSRMRDSAWRSVDPLIAQSGGAAPVLAGRSWLPAAGLPAMLAMSAPPEASTGLARSDVAAGIGPRSDQRGVGAWIDGYGLFGDIDGDSNASDVDYKIGGTSLGVDFRLTDHLLLGVAGGYAYTDVDFDDRPGSGDADTFQGAVYAGYVTPRFYVGLAGRYAYNDMETERRIAFAAINRRAKADFDGYDVGGRAEAGVNAFELGGVAFQPLASFDYVHLQQDSYTESGAGSLNLRVNSESLDSLVSRVGLRIHGDFEIGEENWLVPELRAQWLHEFGDRDRQMDGRITGATTGGAWTVQGAELARDGAVVGTGWMVSASEQLFLFADYDVILNPDLIQHSVAVGFRLRW